MKTSLYLHIGNHKTGTTSVQRALCAKRAELAREGISYFSRFLSRSERKSINRWVVTSGSGADMQGAVHSGLAARLAAAGQRVVASGESFSWLFSPAEISGLQSELARRFDEIKIICYVRRQDEQLLSLHQQGATGSNTDIARFFGNESTALPHYRQYFDLYLDYSQRLEKWAEAFGTENIIVRVCERGQLYRGDVVADFFRAIGAQCEPPSVFFNESRGLEQAKVGHLLNQTGLSGRKEMRRYLLSHLTSSVPRMLPARAEAEALYRRYESSNRKLNQSFGVSAVPQIFAEDFSQYPEQGCENWDETTANHALRELLQAIAELPISERGYRTLAKARLK